MTPEEIAAVQAHEEVIKDAEEALAEEIPADQPSVSRDGEGDQYEQSKNKAEEVRYLKEKMRLRQVKVDLKVRIVV